MPGRVEAVAHAIDYEASVVGIGDDHDREVTVASRAE